MKTILVLITLMISSIGISQTSNFDSLSPISVVSVDRDTLWLAKTPIGYTIAESWDIDLVEDKNIRPTIIFKSEDWIKKEWGRRNDQVIYTK